MGLTKPHRCLKPGYSTTPAVCKAIPYRSIFSRFSFVLLCQYFVLSLIDYRAFKTLKNRIKKHDKIHGNFSGITPRKVPAEATILRPGETIVKKNYGVMTGYESVVMKILPNGDIARKKAPLKPSGEYYALYH